MVSSKKEELWPVSDRATWGYLEWFTFLTSCLYLCFTIVLYTGIDWQRANETV
jgi:hypothetical protein